MRVAWKVGEAHCCACGVLFVAHVVFYLTLLSFGSNCCKEFGENAIVCSINALMTSNSMSFESLQMTLQIQDRLSHLCKRRLLILILEDFVVGVSVEELLSCLFMMC